MSVLVTMHRVITAVIPSLTLDQAENTSPESLWKEAVNAGLIREEETELVGLGEAGMICLHCFSPLEVSGSGKVRIVLDEGADISDLMDVRVNCSRDPSHTIPKPTVDKILKLLRDNGFGYSDIK